MVASIPLGGGIVLFHTMPLKMHTNCFHLLDFAEFSNAHPGAAI